jgi:ubiquinone biosynthesis protein COQ9
LQDGAKIEDFKYLSKRKNISGTYLISITSLPEDEQTSKHGGGGRYNAILEFKGEQIKNEKEKERKKKKRKRRRKKCMYEKKRKIYV